jgi:hypothetical protein
MLDHKCVAAVWMNVLPPSSVGLTQVHVYTTYIVEPFHPACNYFNHAEDGAVTVFLHLVLNMFIYLQAVLTHNTIVLATPALKDWELIFIDLMSNRVGQVAQSL